MRQNPQGAPRVNVSERGYSFDDIKWKFWVHIVILGAENFNIDQL
jgi:hypothetical protein